MCGPYVLVNIQPGAHRFAFTALFVLTLPDVFTYQTLFEFARFADRRKQFCAALAYSP